MDSSAYGPEVHPIHRVIPGLTLATPTEGARHHFEVSDELDLDAAVARLDDPDQTDPQTFAAVVTDGSDRGDRQPSERGCDRRRPSDR